MSRDAHNEGESYTSAAPANFYFSENYARLVDQICDKNNGGHQKHNQQSNHDNANPPIHSTSPISQK